MVESLVIYITLRPSQQSSSVDVLVRGNRSFAKIPLAFDTKFMCHIFMTESLLQKVERKISSTSRSRHESSALALHTQPNHQKFSKKSTVEEIANFFAIENFANFCFVTFETQIFDRFVIFLLRTKLELFFAQFWHDVHQKVNTLSMEPTEMVTDYCHGSLLLLLTRALEMSCHSRTVNYMLESLSSVAQRLFYA